MNILFGYGHEKLNIKLPEEQIISVLKPNDVPIDLTGFEEVKRSLCAPIGSKRLYNIVKPSQKLVIITSDITRPVPSYEIIPPILKELNAAGVKDNDIQVVFALGSHREHTEDEKRKLVGDFVYNRVSCIDSNSDDCLRLGTTSRGTPVDIFRPVIEADIRICVGNIEYHYFAGYSGGAKAIMPGVSTRDAIQANHSRMVQKEAAAGRLSGNPVREDIDEAAKFCSVDFIVNVVLNEKKDIIKCFSGHYLKAHHEGCAFLDKLYKIPIHKKADIVIVSPGGYPKDINMYQAQKALDNAQHAVRDGGVIIWIASCKSGLGDSVFEKWMLEHKKSSDMIENISQNFQLGGHKAAAIAMVLEKARVFLVSDIEAEFVKKVHLEPFNDAESAIKAAFDEIG
ncbi:MAG: nickel-dependent lactate racemase, partial [Clostridia bacterium]|nr:nickel-dependent lactate racemase [Clostridia bacterium]